MTDRPAKNIHTELITITEAARILSCHPNTLRLWDKDGTLKSIRIGRKARRYHKDEIVALVSRPNSNHKQFELSGKDFPIADKSRDIVILFDLNGKSLYINPSGIKLSGYSKKELLGMNVFENIHPDDLNKIKDWQNTHKLQIRLRKRGGQWLWLVVDSFPFEWKGDSYICVSARNITKEKRLEEELKKSEEEANKLIRYAPLAIYEIDFQTQNFLSVNNAICKMTGYTRQELLKMRPADLLDYKSKKLFQKRTEIWLSGIKPKGNVDYKVIAKDGHKIDVELKVTFNSDQNGKPSSATVIGYDLTERKKQEKELENSRKRALVHAARLEALLDSAPVMIWISDSSGKSVIGNKAAEYFLRVKPGTNISESGIQKNRLKHYKMIKDGGELKLSQMPLQKVISTGKPLWNYEIDYQFDDGETRSLIGNVVPIPDLGNNHHGAVATFIDITHLKKLERQKDEFVSIASHELKTPLTSIKAFSQVLGERLKKSGDNQSILLIERADAQINKLITLVTDLLDITKIQAGKLVLNREEIEVDHFIKESVDYIRETMDLSRYKHQISIRGETNCKIYGDKFRLEQVLTNLISNAVKYSPGKERVNITVKASDKHITIGVKDFGIGISKKNIPHLFEKFYQVDSGDKKEKGFSSLGLGLFISSEIVKQHNGKFWVKSNIGKGSTFYFSLPRQID